MIPDDIIYQVIDRSDIVEVISAYIPLKRAGRSFKACCPFHHEKTPSFMVNPDKQIFHCFGCSVGGNVVNFVMKQEHLSFPEAVRLLAKRANVDIPEQQESQGQDHQLRQKIFEVNAAAVEYYHHHLLFDKSVEVKNVRDYLKNRGIDLDAVKKFQLGVSLDQWDGLLAYLKNKGYTLALMEKAGLIIAKDDRQGYYDRFRDRVMFPIFDTMGHCRAFGARTLKEEKNAKYINSPETFVYTKGHHLYGFHLAKPSIAEKDFVIITEGYLDCLIPYQHGVTNVVACLGTALTVDQIRLIRRYTKNVVMLFDKDKAGESAMLRSLDVLIEEGMQVKIASLTDGDDPDSFIRKYGVKQFEGYIENAKPLFDYKLQELIQRFDVKTIEGKSRIADEMLFSIVKIDNAVMRSGYVERLSRQLGLNQQALLSELYKKEQSRSSVKGKERILDVKDKTPEILPSRSVETNILKILLEHQQYIPQFQKDVPLDDLKDQEIRDVISKIYDVYTKEKIINVPRFVHTLPEKRSQELVCELMQEGQIISGDNEKVYQDCVKRIKNDKIRLKRKELVEKIRESERKGDQHALEQLKEEFNTLIKQ